VCPEHPTGFFVVDLRSRMKHTCLSRDVKLLVDFMCGKLARWLRVLGLDAEYSREIDFQKLLRRALSEERTVLTRNTALPPLPNVKVLVLESEIPEAQVKQTIRDLHLERSLAPFSRCNVCNGKLEEVEKEDVREKVPPYTFKTQDEFKRCSGCGRIYWNGTHVLSMRRYITTILEELEIENDV
jgi:uncharacterized protein with PIN domain